MTITDETIERFINEIAAEGKAKSTLEFYTRSLSKFREQIPEDLAPDESLRAYRAYLEQEGYSVATVRAYLGAVSSYLRYSGVIRFSLPKQRKEDHPPMEELTRAEYIRMLQTARRQGKRLPYLLVKLFACTGIWVHELPQVTVEAVKNGQIVARDGKQSRAYTLPEHLQQELLEYAAEKGIHAGPVFRTRNNEKPISRTVVTALTRALCADAQVDPDKGTPQSLQRLYRNTWSGIEQSVRPIVRRSHMRLLEQEQEAVGWGL